MQSLLVLITRASATPATATEWIAVLGILLISLELLGSENLLQLSLVGLTSLLHLLTHLLHTGSLLLGELRTLATTLEITAPLETLTATATHAAASGATHAATTHSVGILGIQFKQLLGLFFVETVFLDGIVSTTLNHLSLVKLGRSTLILLIVILCKGGSTHHHSGCQSYHHLFHCYFFYLLYIRFVLVLKLQLYI